MTVKSLNEYQKNNLARLFVEQKTSLNELAAYCGRSRRTVIRVLEELGIDPGVRHRKPKIVVPVPLTFPNHPIHTGPIGYKPGTSWYSRVLDSVAQLSRRIGISN